MASSKPVMLIATGAWHVPKHYDVFKSKLEALGYEVICPQLRTNGDGICGLTWKADVDLLHEIALPLFDQGREVVLVAHSYGGVPAAAATEGLGVEDRVAQGKSGGFRRIIFICAFAILKEGMDLITTFGGVWPSWYSAAPKYSKNANTSVNAEVIPMFYNDLCKEEAQKAFEMLVPGSQDAYEAPVTFTAGDVTIPKTYIIATKDVSFDPRLQESLATSGPGWDVDRIAGSHSCYLSMPNETARLVAKWAETRRPLLN